MPKRPDARVPSIEPERYRDKRTAPPERLAAGETLEIEFGQEHNEWWGADPEDAPPSITEAT
jgi:putative alpha-1,2-mannosidase